MSIINRVYMAGLLRGKTLPDKGDGEEAAAARLVESNAAVQLGLDRLQSLPTLDATSVATIVAVHGALTRDLATQFAKSEPQSFVSKYLHFHCPIVPIYDQRAWAALGTWIDSHHPGFRVTRDSPSTSDDGCDYYRTFAGRFLLLWNEAQRVRLGTSIKVIDHALWEGRLETETPI